jgi:tRNA A-37 threonylcarbamoyl transferase component Bud32
MSGLRKDLMVAGRYRLLSRQRLPKDFAAGEVPLWRATDHTDRGEVWLQFATDGEVIAGEDRLLTALQTLRLVADPAMPEVLDIGELDGVGFVVIKPVRGRMLAKTLAHGTFSDEDRAELARSAGDALAALQRADVGHGRLTPNSLVLTGAGVVIIDLVVALALAPDGPPDLAADTTALAWLLTLTHTGVAAAREAWGDEFVNCYVTDEVSAARVTWAATVLTASGAPDETVMRLVAALGPTPPAPSTALAIIEPRPVAVMPASSAALIPMAEMFDERPTPAHAAPARFRRELTVAAVTVLLAAVVLGIVFGTRSGQAAASGGGGVAAVSASTTTADDAGSGAAALAAVTTATTSAITPATPTTTTVSPTKTASTITAGATSSTPSRPVAPTTSASGHPTSAPPPATPTCSASVAVSSWDSGYEAIVTVTNTGSAAITGWTVTFSLPYGQQVSNAYEANMSQSGQQVTATNVSNNGALAARGDSTQWGFQVRVRDRSYRGPGNVSCVAN